MKSKEAKLAEQVLTLYAYCFERYATRSHAVSEALGKTGCDMLDRAEQLACEIGFEYPHLVEKFCLKRRRDDDDS